MRSRPDNSRRAERGQIMVLTVLVLPVFLGAAAMAVDIGVMWAVEAKLRTVADAAALAGAEALVQGKSTQCRQLPRRPRSRDANGYTAFGQTSTVTVNIPPAAPSAFAGQSDCVQVVVQFNQPALFSAIWGVQTLPITVEAVAQTTMQPYSTAAILLLSPSGTAMTLSGSTQVVTVNGGIMVDSTSALVDHIVRLEFHHHAGARSGRGHQVLGDRIPIMRPSRIMTNRISPIPWRILPLPAPAACPSKAIPRSTSREPIPDVEPRRL